MTDKREINLKIFCRDGSRSLPKNKTSVVALGTFDGVHIAHQELLKVARDLKIRVGADLTGVWCFEDSPAATIKGLPPTSLTSKEERVARLIELGADFVVMGGFCELCSLGAEDFIDGVLVERLGAVGTVCGYNHRFGHRGMGTPRLLEERFSKENAVTVPMVSLKGEAVSSSAIRKYLAAGETEKANEMLGRPFSFTSKVTEGKRLGRKLGFPTANQPLPCDLAELKNGVYASICVLPDEQRYMGVSNVGIRPSIESGDDHKINCETYVIDFSGELYGLDLKIELHAYIREEKKFSSLEELSHAIELDRESAVKFFSKNTL